MNFMSIFKKDKTLVKSPAGGWHLRLFCHCGYNTKNVDTRFCPDCGCSFLNPVVRGRYYRMLPAWVVDSEGIRAALIRSETPLQWEVWKSCSEPKEAL